MAITNMHNIVKVLQGPLFWWLTLCASALSIIVALYFQYALDEGPCALCIHIRIYMIGLMLVSIAGLLLRALSAKLILYWLTAALCVGLALTSWELYGVEKGFIPAGCTIGAGLPAWFNLEDWMPSLFASWGLCGITPDVIFGISMADALMPASIAAAILACSAAVLMSLTFTPLAARFQGK